MLSCRRLEAPPFQRGHALSGQPGARGFHFAHRDEQGFQLIGRDLGHDGTAAGTHLDEAGSGELPESLAHRRAGHTIALCQLLLVEAVSGSELAGKDGIGDLSRKFVRVGLVLGCHGRFRGFVII